MLPFWIFGVFYISSYQHFLEAEMQEMTKKYPTPRVKSSSKLDLQGARQGNRSKPSKMEYYESTTAYLSDRSFKLLLDVR